MMLAIGLSEICRKRLRFPENDFVLRTAGDMKVKVVHLDNLQCTFELDLQVLNPYADDGKVENVGIMKSWMRQIFEWTEKGWLQKVILTISTGVSPFRTDGPALLSFTVMG